MSSPSSSMDKAGLDADVLSDVIVVGGGPGGTTTATMLARKGWRVLLLEREHFPRDHVGESLLPASIPVLDELGALPAIQEAGFLPKWGATMVWGREREPWSWYFKETNTGNPHSYQVWRPRFDQLLLENSRVNGVDAREGHRVLEVLFEDDRAVGVRYAYDRPGGDSESGDRTGEGVARARFIVDATGQVGLLGRRLQLRQWDPFFQNLAVYAYFAGSQRLPGPAETNIFIEAYQHGWLWNIPLHTGWASVGAVVDSPTGQEGISSRGAEGFLMDQIAQAPHTAWMLKDAKLVSGPSIVRDWSYVSERVVGDGYILVGDAACFVDPLFSSGVHLALMSGVLAAAYVTTALKDPGMKEAAGQVYKELYYKEYNHFREMAKLFYSSNRTVDSYFWEARRLLGNEESLSPRHAFIQAVAGQPPRGYERVVLEQGEAPGRFVSSVRMVEEGRADRRERLAAARTHSDITRNPVYHAVPRLAEGVQVHRKPVVGEGEFVWGYVLATPSQPEGTPCSSLVAWLVHLIDGQTPVAGLMARLRSNLNIQDEVQGAQLELSAIATLHILYVDGTVDFPGDFSGEGLQGL